MEYIVLYLKFKLTLSVLCLKNRFSTAWTGFFFMLVMSSQAQGQTFSSSSTVSITSGFSFLSNTINVSGLPNSLDGVNIGVSEISISLNTQYDYPLIEIEVVAPDGTMAQIMGSGSSSGNGATGTFNFKWDWALPWIRNWNPNNPIDTLYRPIVNPATFNNGQNPNGTWKILARVNGFVFGTNQITGWSITFSSTSSDIQPAEPYEDCSNAGDLLNYTTTGDSVHGDNNNHGGNISEANILKNCYTDTYPYTTTWYKFTAACSTDVIKVYAYGLPYVHILTGTCGGSITQVSCYQFSTAHSYYSFSFGTGSFPALNPGQTYYVLLEGQNGITDQFDIWWIPGSCKVQPVDLVYFRGKFSPGSNVLEVDWETAWETASKGYDLYYRLLGSNEFLNGGFTASRNGDQQAVYTQTIPVTQSGLYEVKLLQTDLDGSSKAFDPIFIYADLTADNPVNITGNPTAPAADIFVSKDATVYYSLISVTGQELLSGSLQGRAGWNHLELPRQTPGLYLLNIHTGEFNRTEKMVW